MTKIATNPTTASNAVRIIIQVEEERVEEEVGTVVFQLGPVIDPVIDPEVGGKGGAIPPGQVKLEARITLLQVPSLNNKQ